ncbi:hypothetical protein SPONN_2829 [uncultured Candidatus Thioglobus sp.]|nr:hypothetical protein SPONN_2829 [uncultured Candidatus Thioglobus sp.]
MNNLATSEKGFLATKKKIEKFGGIEVNEHKEGKKKYITFTSTDGREFKITTRSKASGTWQTDIRYGKKCLEKINEKEYWIFIDLKTEPNIFYKFYVVPLWWIQNDIYTAHERYTSKYHGRRDNDDSKHHGIELKRIEKWHNKWELIGLKA